MHSSTFDLDPKLPLVESSTYSSEIGWIVKDELEYLPRDFAFPSKNDFSAHGYPFRVIFLSVYYRGDGYRCDTLSRKYIEREGGFCLRPVDYLKPPWNNLRSGWLFAG